MTRRSIDGLGHARGGAVAPAIVRRAEIGTPFHHLSRDFYVRRVGIVALFFSAPRGLMAPQQEWLILPCS